eukprot:360098-Chlamydomonas_euryale.AAC.6
MRNHRLQVQLTSGPKKHALELMRKKIEVQNERCVLARQRHGVAKAAFQAADIELQAEEGEKVWTAGGGVAEEEGVDAGDE